MRGIARRSLGVACVLVTLASCKDEKPQPVGATTPHDTMPPAIWSLQTVRKKTCVWKEIVFRGDGGTRDVATFPAPCEEADLAWSGQRAIVWLHGGRPERFYTLTMGSAPVELSIPDGEAVHAVGFDDAPLLFTTPNRATADDIRVWAWDGNAWIERERVVGKRLGELPIWRAQRGNAARKQREPKGLTPLPAEEIAKIGGARSPEADLDRLGQALSKNLDQAASGVPIVVPPETPAWWQLDAGGVKLALRDRQGRPIPDVRRFADGQWSEPPMARPSVDGLRAAIWAAGVEVRGTWVLLSSDGRGGTLFDAKNGLKLWGSDTALSLFAP